MPDWAKYHYVWLGFIWCFWQNLKHFHSYNENMQEITPKCMGQSGQIQHEPPDFAGGGVIQDLDPPYALS